jgi:type IV pilus assembly protein PilE
MNANAHCLAGGFTLVEMLCAVVVAIVLSSIAYPSFLGVVHRARRAEALVVLMQVQMAQERYRADHPTYGDLSDLGVAATSPGGRYTLDMAANSATGFELRAAASGSQSADRACRHMKLTVDGFDVAYASGPSTAFANNAAENERCWNP